MIVSEFLSVRGTPPIKEKSSEPLHDAVLLMKTQEVSAVLVSDDGKSLDGIITERDVVKCLCDEAGHSSDMNVEDIMTRKLITCSPGDDVSDLLPLMHNNHIRHIPVLDRKGHIAGLIGLGELVHDDWHRAAL